MADDQKPKGLTRDYTAGRPAEEFISGTFPTIYADGVSSISATPPLMKMFLFRTDPNVFGRGGAVVNPFVQLVMPVEGFIHTVAFFSWQIEKFIEDKVITQEQFDQAKKAITDLNDSLASNGK